MLGLWRQIPPDNHGFGRQRGGASVEWAYALWGSQLFAFMVTSTGARFPVTGGLFGGTVGATVDLADTGLKADYIDAVSGRLLPGHAALVAEVEEFSTQPVDEAVWRHGGVIFRHPTTYVTA